MFVCNINGDLRNGDLICSSSIPGYGMKQDDDIIRAYTVAKITCHVDFKKNYPKSKYPLRDLGNGVKAAFVGVTYKF
jgi:hypothetical protein